MSGENKPPKLPQPKPRGLLPVTLLFIAMLLLAIWMTNIYDTGEEDWTTFLVDLRQGRIARVVEHLNHVVAEPAKGGAARPYRVYYPGTVASDSTRQAIQEAIDEASSEHRMNVLREGAPPEGPWVGILVQVVILVGLFLLLWFLFFRRMGQGGGVLSFGKSRATLITKGKTGKTFKDVAGIDEAKDEVEELVEFLKQPKKFQKLGGRIPRGVLLVGPPGTGKTLLAKAIAGEADVPFYSISGSDFVEMFVGVGASRVRDLFQQAKDNAPCIIFIDEIDAVARRRGSGVGSGGHDEREQTLNAILVEMDGFSSNDKVIIIAATNRLDVLDPALIRPGRFDRHIHVDLPDITGREQILQVHAGKVRLSADVDLDIIARGTPGFSGADLENLINEAALNAARHNQDAVYHADFEYARDRVAFGRERKVGSAAMPPEERRITAYHEAGHAILQHLLPECDDLHKVTIIPRGRALGATMHLPKDRHTHSKRKLLGDICTLFGGRIAEERFCGDITTGASNDIDRATAIARTMIYELGMSERMGPIRYTEDHDSYAGRQSVVAVSPETQRELDAEVRSVLEAQYRRAEDLIGEQSEVVEAIAQALLEYETLNAEQVKLLVKGGRLEPRQPATQTVGNKPVAQGETDRDESGPALEPSLA